MMTYLSLTVIMMLVEGPAVNAFKMPEFAHNFSESLLINSLGSAQSAQFCGESRSPW